MDLNTSLATAALMRVSNNVYRDCDLQTTTMSDSELAARYQFQFYAYGVTGSVVSVLGIMGNILSTIVLSHSHMTSSTSCYLIALASFDTLVLISLLLLFTLPIINDNYRQHIYPYIHPYGYPMALTALTCSIYTTVGFTVERYIAVCHALRSAKWCTIARARKSLLCITVCAIIYNIPRMCEYKTVLCNYYNVSTITTYEKTAFGKHEAFRHIYLLYLQLIFMWLLPFVTLVTLNMLLLKAVRQSQRTQGRISTGTTRRNNLTMMLIAVVAVFLVCQVPSIVCNMIDVITKGSLYDAPAMVKFDSISNLFVVTNSAVNFYLYCCFGHKFRQIFISVFTSSRCVRPFYSCSFNPPSPTNYRRTGGDRSTAADRRTHGDGSTTADRRAHGDGSTAADRRAHGDRSTDAPLCAMDTPHTPMLNGDSRNNFIHSSV